MQKMLGWARLSALASLLLGCGPALAYTGAKWNLPEGVTQISRDVHHLHMLIFWVCVAIACAVFGVMFYSVFAHRKSRHPKPADFHESTLVEIIWTSVPFIILVAMAIPAAATLVKMDDTRNSDMTVKITGYQWKWRYDYVGQDIGFFSTLSADANQARQLKSGIDVNTVPNYLVDVDNPLVLPVGKKIRFLVTANDVIHAWWVPALAVKKDAIPGYVNEVWTRIDEPGIYRGVCAELCGRDHGFMPIVVKAVTEAEYAEWLAGQKGGEKVAEVASIAPVAVAAAEAPAVAAAPAAAEAAAASKELSKEELIASGEKVYNTNCAACHQAGGGGLPPTFPSLHGSPKIKGPAAVQIEQVINGKAPMPPFGQLSDADIAAVVTYTRNSWGNSSGVVQPAQVAAVRK